MSDDLVARLRGCARGPEGLANKAADRIESLQSELATVKDENAKLRRDAERYRWLAADGDRAQALLTRLSGHEVEHAIDAALGSQPEGSQVAPGADEIKAERDALIYAVARKFPGESRFQTALRYITEAENRSAQCTGEAALPPKEGG